MRAVSLLIVVAAALAGCEACTYPFSVEAGGTLNIPLGIAADCMGEGTVPEDGQPDDEGNLTRFTHAIVAREDGPRCVMHADWSGPLVDVSELRADAEDEMRANGIDPDDVEVRITSITPTIETVGLRGRGTEALAAPGIVTYRGALSIEGDEEIIVVTLAEDGDPANPEVVVRESPRLIELANEAWLTGEDVPATGTADVSINLRRVGDLGDLPPSPRLRVDFAVTLEGDAGLGS